MPRASPISFNREVYQGSLGLSTIKSTVPFEILKVFPAGAAGVAGVAGAPKTGSQPGTLVLPPFGANAPKPGIWGVESEEADAPRL